METILKKYFWVVNLMVIGICAGFAGRAAGHLVESAYLAGDDVKQPMKRPVIQPQQKVHAKDGDTITQRDIFCSGCAPIKPPDPVPGGPVSNDWVKTSLQIELVSTLYVPNSDTWSMAVMRDLTTKEKDPEMFSKGMTIGTTGATVEKVLPKRVYLLNAGKREYVDLDANAAPPANAPVAQNTPPTDTNNGDIPDSGINCSGGTKCTIQRSVVDKLLSNTAALATSARFVPSIKDGKPNGFKLYAIQPKSIFGRIGLQNGDTIKAINGSDMTTPDAALALYTKLRNASHLSVTVDRRGETVPLDYTIQ